MNWKLTKPPCTDYHFSFQDAHSQLLEEEHLLGDLVLMDGSVLRWITDERICMIDQMKLSSDPKVMEKRFLEIFGEKMIPHNSSTG